MTDPVNRLQSRLKTMIDLAVYAAGNARHVLGAVFDVRVGLVLIRGKIRGSDQTGTMLYVGRGMNLAYLKGKLLLDAEVIQSKNATLWSYRKKMAAFEQKADFSFIDIGLPYQNRLAKSGDYLVLPDWLSMIVPLAGDWDNIEAAFNKTTRKLIRRNTYRCEISSDPAVIGRFYDDFYLPYVTLRHEDAAIEPRSAIEKRAKQGGILQVLDDDGPVVAGVIYPEDGVLYYLWLGMAKHYLDTQPEGALFASYYFCLRHAHENGFRAADWQGTRSFPKDGVFQFKRKWGAVVDDAFSPDAILFKPADNNPAAIAFAESFPFIARRGGKLEQVFCTTAQTLEDADVKRLIAPYQCGGIERIVVAHVTENAQKPTLRHLDSDPDVAVLGVSAQQFSSAYGRALSIPE